MSKITVIGEIGINWMGDVALAKEMIDSCKDAGADIAKFQLFRPKELLGQDSPYLAEAERGVPTKDQISEFKDYCDAVSIEFGLSVFHADLVDFTEDLGLRRYKIGSRAFLDTELLERVNKTKKPIIASTGTATEENIYRCLDILRDCPDITLMYCVPNYPTSLSSINLAQLDMVRSILTHVERQGQVGFSSHCPKLTPTIAAAARGATVIEHHIVKYKSMKGCDVSSSLNFVEFKRMVEYIREMEKIKL